MVDINMRENMIYEWIQSDDYTYYDEMRKSEYLRKHCKTLSIIVSTSMLLNIPSYIVASVSFAFDEFRYLFLKNEEKIKPNKFSWLTL